MESSKLLSYSNGDSPCIQQFKDKVSNEIKRRWSFDHENILILCSALDPRFKNLQFIDDDEVKELLGPETITTTLTHREELDAYMAESLPPRSTCPLLWWKDNSTKFPLVSKVAKCFLNIPATSTPSERVFSTGGNTVTQQRSSLKPGNVDALIFFNKNAHSFS